MERAKRAAASVRLTGSRTQRGRGWISRRRRLALAASIAGCGLVLSIPNGASAAFTRALKCASPAGVLGENGGGLAVDPEGHVWASEGGPSSGGVGITRLYEFESACEVFLGPGAGPKPLEFEALTAPSDMAFDRLNGNFYLTGTSRADSDGYVEEVDKTGKLVKRWEDRFGPPQFVAVDNSLELSAGTVYVSHREDPPSPEGDGLPGGIGKFNAEGSPLEFTSKAKGSGCKEYVTAHEILGTEEECGLLVEALTTDAHGDIYVVDTNADDQEKAGVYEFESSGKFVRAFLGRETPGLGEDHVSFGGFGAPPIGVAVDPVSGDVLISIHNGLAGSGKGAIDEFDASGHFLNQITRTPGGGQLRSPGALATDAQGDVYVFDAEPGAGEGHIYRYGPGAFLPTLKLFEATERTPTSALVSGTVDPEGQPLTSCEVEYVTRGEFEGSGFTKAQSVECEPKAAEITTKTTVHAKLSPLAAGVTYEYRLAASSSGALGGTADSEQLAFTTPHAPRIDATSATNVSSQFVELNAKLAPLGAATQYQFQYVDQAHYDPSAEDPYAAGQVAPSTPSSIGTDGPTGGADASVVQQVGGLSPDTVYHFRVVASNAFGVTPGPDATFTTLPAAAPGLPDGRAYELVTPPDKGDAADMFALPNGNNEFVNKDGGYAAETGNEFLLETFAAFGSSEQPFPASGHNAYVFSRTPSGWRTIPLASPSLGVQTINGTLADPFDLSQVAINDGAGSTVATGGLQLVSMTGPPGGPYVALHADAALHQGEAGKEATTFVGASSDLSDMVLETTGHAVCPGASTQVAGTTALCEWSGAYEIVGEGELKPELTLVNVNSAGALLSRCGAMLGQGHVRGTAHNAVSADGSSVIFTAPDPDAASGGSGCWNPATQPETNAPQLYLRREGTTTEVSAPEAGVSDPTGAHPAVYVGAAEDGSRIFFLTSTELTKDALQLKLHDDELYEYDVATRQLTRISAAAPGSPGGGASGAGVFTVPAVSASGDVVYFTAIGRLTSNAPEVHGEEVNLYRYEASSATLTYVTTVNTADYPADQPNWTPRFDIGLLANADWYTTPDGRYLLFATGRELVGYNTQGNCVPPHSQGASNGHCDELYRYDADTQSIVCVSCNPSGAPPVSNALFARSAEDTSPASGPMRAMSNDGAYVFFDTADSLVPRDANGTLDVYEWHEGQISLISSGEDPAPSYFLGADASGSNVFFGTHARLVPQDTDTDGDIYDARICAAADPCIKPPVAGSGQCEGGACQTPPPAPLDLTPASLTFTGPGNLANEPPPPPARETEAQRRAKKLAAALKACRKLKSTKKRTACEKSAHQKYGTSKAKKSAKRSSRRGK